MSAALDLGKVRRLSVKAWANEIAAIKNGDAVTMPDTLMSLDYGDGTVGGFLPFLMPAGRYSRDAKYDLVTFSPDREAGEPR